MRTFNATYIMESQRMLNKKTIGLLLLFLLLSLYFVQMGINNYKSTIENKKSFQDIERIKVKEYINYSQYGTYGFRLMFIPCPLSVYFVNSSVISELTSNVDSGERLNIYNSFKGKTLFAGKSGGFKDFSGIMLLLGSLLVLYFGYEAMIHKDYLRFMAGFADHKKLFLSIIHSRVLILILFFALNGGISLILLKINGILLSGSQMGYLLIYLGILLLTQVFFFALGTIAGSFKSRFAGFVTVVAAWFVLVFLVPGVVSAVTAHKADNIISNYQLELEKLKIIMGFEQTAYDKQGPIKANKSNTEVEQEMMERAWNNEFKEIRALEKKLESEMEENVRGFQKLSLHFPSTFYLSAGNEISSKGYENFLRFFGYVQTLKKQFVRFYINKRYYSNYEKVESFIKGSENLYYAGTRLPRAFIPGVGITLLYIVLLFAVSYNRFKRSVKL